MGHQHGQQVDDDEDQVGCGQLLDEVDSGVVHPKGIVSHGGVDDKRVPRQTWGIIVLPNKLMVKLFLSSDFDLFLGIFYI
jgi:hypothetical protein